MKQNAKKNGQKGKRRRKQTATNMFIRGFLQSFFIVAILTAGIIGYQLTLKLWMVEPEKTEVVEKPKPTPVPITVPNVDEVSKNLIFCYDSDNHTIDKLVLEIFHCERNRLTYITIPMSTQFTMSEILYKKLVAVQPSIPQVLRLSTMSRYLDASVVFDYGVLIIEDMLKLNISYYSVMPVELYQSVFEERSIPEGTSASSLVSKGNTEAADEPEAEAVVAEVFKKEYIELLDTLEGSEELSNYIEKLYEDMKSNLPVDGKMSYVESYLLTSLDDVSFIRIAGYEKNSGFVVDEIRLPQQLLELGAY